MTFEKRWKAAYNRVLVALLEDLRVFRTAKCVPGAHSAGAHLVEVSMLLRRRS